MSEEDFTELRSFSIDLNNTDSFEINSKEIKKLVDAGFKNVTVKIYGSSKQASTNLGKDENLFENIKKVQSLPDNVVYDFLNCKGTLADTDLKQRFADE